jgi:poly(ADP-ribose) glycohydrolase
VTALRGVERVPLRDLGGFVRLRSLLARHPCAVTGLEAVLAREPGLAARFFSRVLPSLIHHAGTMVQAPLPSLLPCGRDGRTELSRALAASVVAHMVLGSLPAPRLGEAGFPHTSFDRLLASLAPQEQAKLRCVLHYFDRVADGAPAGTLTVTRRALAALGREDWARDESPLGPLTEVPAGGIEDARGCLQVDFANRYLGGGVLSGGCVQEEIRFAVSPELLAAMPLCPVLGPGEAVSVHGAERFAAFSGYAFTLAFAGDHRDPCPRASDGTPDVTVVAMDALDFRRHPDLSVQFGEALVLRELLKALAGLSCAQDVGGEKPVATGHWGCGVFGGHPQLKALLQWLAASRAGHPVRYHTYGDGRCGALEDFCAAARTRFGSVGALFSRYLQVTARGLPAGDGWREPWIFPALLEGA